MLLKRKSLIGLIFSGLFLFPAAAETGDSLPPKSRNLSVLPVPAFGYEPETKAYVGAVCLFNWRFGPDTTVRLSNAKLEVNYTQRKQFINEAVWNAFTPKERYFTSGRVHFSRFPDYYWGKGNTAADSNRVSYSSLRFTAEGFWLKNIGKNWFLGPVLRYVKFGSITYQAGPEHLYLQLKPHEALGIPGITLSRDTRNNILLPAKGMYFFFQPLFMYKKRALYPRISLDMRKYFTIKKTSILSLQCKTLLSGSESPFDLAVFGGDAVARGFYAGRYRSDLFSTLQSEWKFTIYRRWGLAIFGGISGISGVTNTWNHNNIKYNGGTGLRFLIDRKENINMRLDMAWASEGQKGFYVVFGEAF